MTDNELKKEKDRIVHALEQSELLRKKCQSNLRLFVTNKNYSLDERFEVWSKYCDKEHKDWILHDVEFGCIGAMVNDLWPHGIEEGRYRTYDWSYFYDAVSDDFEYEDKYQSANQYVSDLDEFKEILIETNFGSFVYDW